MNGLCPLPLSVVIGEVGPAGTELRCTAFSFYKPIPDTSDVQFQFVVVPDLDIVKKVCLNLISFFVMHGSS